MVAPTVGINPLDPVWIATLVGIVTISSARGSPASVAVPLSQRSSYCLPWAGNVSRAAYLYRTLD